MKDDIPGLVEMTISLAALGQRAKSHHESVEKFVGSALASAIDAGTDLLAAKKLVPHGSFLDWVVANTGISKRLAQAYMKLGEHHPLLGDPGWRGPMSIREALKKIANLLLLKELLPKPGQRVRLRFMPNVFIGLLGSVSHPGFVYVAKCLWPTETRDGYIDVTRRPYRADGFGLHMILNCILGHDDEDQIGLDDLRQLECRDPENARPFCEELKGQIETVPWDYHLVHSDVIFGIQPANGGTAETLVPKTERGQTVPMKGALDGGDLPGDSGGEWVEV